MFVNFFIARQDALDGKAIDLDTKELLDEIAVEKGQESVIQGVQKFLEKCTDRNRTPEVGEEYWEKVRHLQDNLNKHGEEGMHTFRKTCLFQFNYWGGHFKYNLWVIVTGDIFRSDQSHTAGWEEI